ncbi:MAG: DUF1097 domain-containing protein [Legionella sp.]|nr:MAG: DUF1097 domain-containing protein [Legionella sp.]
MFDLEKFSDEELFKILNCTKLSLLHKLVSNDKIQGIYETIKNTPSVRRIPNKILQALLDPIANTATYPFLILWSLIGIAAGIGTLPATLCIAFLILSSSIIGGFNFYANYKELQKKEFKLNKILLLSELKNQAADLLLKRLEIKMELVDVPDYPDRKELTFILESIKVGMLISTSLFGTYFLGFLSLFSSILISPLGLLIALGVALGIGVYFGYYHYQMIKQEDVFNFNQKCQTLIIEEKIKLCNNIVESPKEEPLFEITLQSRPIYTTLNLFAEDQSNKHLTYKLHRTSPFFFQPVVVDDEVFYDASDAIVSTP